MLDHSTFTCMVTFFRDYSSQLQEYKEQCTALLSEVSQALEFLKGMKKKHLFVSQKTGALHQACEQLVEEQVMSLVCKQIHVHTHTHTNACTQIHTHTHTHTHTS